MPVHPKNTWMRNGSVARALIFLSRHRVPALSRVSMLFLACNIGCALPRNIFIPHPLGIVIHTGTRLGNDVVLGHQVTLGVRGLSMAAPVINIGAGAKVLGELRIGRGATVGANAVVTQDVPPGAVVVRANRILPNRNQYALDLRAVLESVGQLR